MLKYLLFDQVDDRGYQASIFTEGPGSARQPGHRPRRSTALVKHEILQKWGVLWVPRWIISSCITNKITSPNQPNIWMPLCNNVFWHFFRGWGGGYNWRQSCDKSTVKLSTTVAFCDMSTVEMLTVDKSTVYFSTSPFHQINSRQLYAHHPHHRLQPTTLTFPSPCCPY